MWKVLQLHPLLTCADAGPDLCTSGLVVFSFHQPVQMLHLAHVVLVTGAGGVFHPPTGWLRQLTCTQ